MDRDDALRGRFARNPTQIPASGWKDIAARVWRAVRQHNICIIAAGVAFFLLLAAGPVLGALVALYGLLADPGKLASNSAALGVLLPESVVVLVTQHLRVLADASPRAVGAGVIGSLLFGGWSATRAMNAVIAAINVAYGESESRGFVRLTATALAFAAGTVAFVAAGVVLIGGVPEALRRFPMSAAGYWSATAGAWAMLIALQLLALAALYRYAPDRARPRWTWTSSGALVATFLCMVAWAALALLAKLFVHSTVSALGAMVLVMSWAFMTAYAVLLGAETNAEAERQTRRDTTDGPPLPLGKRRARAANTIGETTREGSKSSSMR
jgi:membrane protein